MPGLKTTLRLNAASCLVFGAAFLILPDTVARYLSESPAPGWLFQLIGTILVLNGGPLIFTSIKKQPSRHEILYFTGGDVAWVLATAALILTGTWVTTVAGISAAIAVAAVVGCFGFMQMTALKRGNRLPPDINAEAIGRG